MLTIPGPGRNHGFVPLAPAECQWLLDGATVGGPIAIPALAQGDETAVELHWPWEPVQDELTLRVELAAGSNEISSINDQLTVHTYALNLVVVCEPTTYAEFGKVENFLGTCSWEDWWNAHLGHMNDLFRDAIYPVTPHGVDERVRVDRIWVGSREEWDAQYGSQENPVQFQGHDGGWWYAMPDRWDERAAVMDWVVASSLADRQEDGAVGSA